MAFFDLSGTVLIKRATLLTVEEAKQIPVNILKFLGVWWLRSPGKDPGKVAVVNYDGSIYEQGCCVNSVPHEVRPALLLQSSGLPVGSRLQVGIYDFTVVLPEIALSDTTIATMCFDRETDDYERSDIRKSVDDWFYFHASQTPDPADLIITSGATLLSAEEAKKLPKKTLAYDSWWWLRSEGFRRPHFAAVVDKRGFVDSVRRQKSIDTGAVRPVLTLESDDYEVGDKFAIGSYSFTVILPKLALLDWHIKMSYFDSDSNPYESSEIRRIVDKWFRDKIETNPVVVAIKNDMSA